MNCTICFSDEKNDRDIDYEDHNLWLLDERLVFSHYIASDKVISKDIHKEPDIAVFYNEKMFFRNGENVITSPITIVEFKRPKGKTTQMMRTLSNRL